MATPFIKSNYQRVPGDYYPTVDGRCISGLIEHFTESLKVGIVDVCAPDGSGIVDAFRRMGYEAQGWDDAFLDTPSEFNGWIVTNPPYTRPLVDRIIERQIERVTSGEVLGLAVLLRAGFDFAKSRAVLFEHLNYYGQIKLRFRPWWSDEHTAQPIHNYAWHVWLRRGRSGMPVVMYSDGVPLPNAARLGVNERWGAECGKGKG